MPFTSTGARQHTNLAHVIAFVDEGRNKRTAHLRTASVVVETFPYRDLNGSPEWAGGFANTDATRQVFVRISEIVHIDDEIGQHGPMLWIRTATESVPLMFVAGAERERVLALLGVVAGG